jgi:UTP:GlnB (protein PII) uridylyltransferase
LGFGSDGPAAAAALMRAYYAQAAAIHRFSEGLIARVTEEPTAGRFMRRAGGRQIRPGVLIQGRVLAIGEKDFFVRAPLNLINIFADCQAHEVELSGSAYQQVRDNLYLIDDAFRSDRRTGLAAPARGRDARGDASRGRAWRGHSRVRQSLRPRASRPLPHLHR